MLSILPVLILVLSVFVSNAHGLCHLPNQWSGKWYQSKDLGDVHINRTHFLNRGICIEHREDKFLLYESKEECYRCVFIIQKHVNVLQYRATYCSDQNDFLANCQNLSPESELITVYRENTGGERCPLSGLYVASRLTAASNNNGLEQQHQQGFNSFDRTYRSSSSTKCNEDEDGKKSESMIMECSDQSMLKLQFGKCSSLSTFIISCIAHWNEGSTNYLIGRVEPKDSSWTSNNNNNNNNNNKSVYKCISYSEISSGKSSSSAGPRHNQDQLRQARHQSATGDLDPTSSSFSAASSGFSRDNIEIFEKSVLQILVSPDEFCRSIDTILDEQFSFTFNKVFGSRYHIAPPPTTAMLKSHHHRNQHHSTNKRDDKMNGSSSSSSSSLSSRNAVDVNRKYVITHANCKFPKWLNRKWFNFKQTKSFQLDYRLDSLVVTDEKSAVVINKYTCTHMKSKRSNHVQAIVKALNGCSSGYQCLTINSKSEYVLEIKFGKISYESSKVSCSYPNDFSSELPENNDTDAYISREYVYVDTNYGVKCPLKAGIYEKINSKQAFQQQQQQQQQNYQTNEYALPVVIDATSASDPTTTTTTTRTTKSSTNEPCKYLTQTQTLQIGCLNEQQYSLRTRLCYPNQQQQQSAAGAETASSDTVGSSLEDDTYQDQTKGRTWSGNRLPHHHNHQQQHHKKPTTAYTQLESEINLVCLADWVHDGNHVIVSRTMSNEILCSIWTSSDDGRLLQLLEIDSNCNYDLKKPSNSFYQDRGSVGGGSGNSGTINYGFMFMSECSGQQQQQQQDQQQDNESDGNSFRLSAASISDDFVVSSASCSSFYPSSWFFGRSISAATTTAYIASRYNRSFFGSQIFRTVFFIVAVLVVVFVALS